MEETQKIPETTNATPGLLINSLSRALLTLISFVAAVVCIGFATIYTVRSITTIPTVFYRSLTDPFVAFLCTLAHVLTILAVISLGVFLFTIAYRLVHRLTITTWHFTTCLILAILSVILITGATPVFADFANTSAYPDVLNHYLTLLTP